MTNRIAGTFDPARVSAQREESNDTQAPRSAVEQAVASQHVNTVIKQDPEDRHGTNEERARRGMARRDDAVATVLSVMDEWFISDADAGRALTALKGLKPNELNQALRTLQDRAKLDAFVDELTPEQLADFTATLTRGGIFRWETAVDENGQTRPAYPKAIVQSGELPNALRALAHDVNVEIARQHPGMRFYEPGPNGSPVSPDDRLHMDWTGGVVGFFENGINRYLNVSDVERSVERLRPGESYKNVTSLGVKVDLGKDRYGFGAEVKAGPQLSGGVEVSRDAKGGYTVAAESAVLAQISATLDVGVAELSGAASQGGSGRVEFSYKTREEATRAAALLTDWGPSTVAKLATDKSARALLAENISAIELGPEIAASLGAGLKVPKGPFEGSVKDEGTLAVRSGVRLEFERGRPSALVSKSSLELELGAVAEGELEVAHLRVKGGRSMSVRAAAEMEQRATIKPGMSLKDAASAAINSTAKMNFSVEHTTGFRELDGATKLEFESNGPSTRFLSAALALQRGDAETAIDALGELEVTASTTGTMRASYGIEGGEGIEVGGSVTATHKHVRGRQRLSGPQKDEALRLLSSLADGRKAGGDVDRGFLRGD